MEYFSFMLKLTLISFTPSLIAETAGLQDTPYQPVEEICKTCTCLSQLREGSTKISRFFLNCNAKKFQHILPKWPEEFGTNIGADVEIIAKYSENPVKSLQQLPETDAELYFVCRHCELTEIASAAFIDTKNIIKLDLSWNKLNGAALHPDVFRGRFSDQEYAPIGLEVLVLSHNEIESLDSKAFEHLTHLRELNLSYNKLASVDKKTQLAIGMLPTLEDLDFSYNNMETLPGVMLRDLVNLTNLNLDGNMFTRIPPSLPAVGGSLEALSIGNNPIQKLGANSFIGLTKLSFLNISRMTDLTTIGLRTFAPLVNLEVLLCNNNGRLSQFNLNGLIENENFKELDISNCNLAQFEIGDPESEVIEPNVTIKWTALRSLSLASNPWFCDCHLVKLLKDVERTGYNQFYKSNETKCGAPSQLNGTLFRDLSYDELCRPLVRRKKLKIPIHEPATYARPRSIAVSIISVSLVVLLGLVCGYIVVFVKQRLRRDKFGFAQPIRYTTVRDSTISVE